MANFTQDNTRIRALIEILKADLCLSIWDEAQNKMLFDGKVYQLYDNSEFDHCFIENMLISFDRVSISIRH